MNKTRRLILLLKMLEEGKKPTIYELAELLCRSQRTIFRDIEDLREIQIPIRFEGGRYLLDKRVWRVWQSTTLTSQRSKGENSAAGSGADSK